jgi:hypothetical protein
MEATADETKEKVEVEVNDASITTRESKMRARVKLMAERMNEQSLMTERRGAQHTVFFLDPITALALDDEEDKETVCHVHTLNGETMRYAVETTETAQVRMMLDDVIARSLSAIPAHVTTGVIAGNISDRFQRVVLFFDDIGRKALIEQIDADFSSLTKRERESFAAFTSRVKDIEFRMKEQRMTIDPELMLSKLERAITTSKDEGVRNVLGQVKMAIGLPTSTTEELLVAMAGPMRDFEKERKATQERANKINHEKIKAEQEQVNALHVGQYQRGGKGRGRGGRGRGGKGAKGGKGANCLKFAKGSCARPDCPFNHVALSAKDIQALKATMAAKRAARAAGGTAQHRSSGGHTAAEVVNALKATPVKAATLKEKMEALRTSGLTDEQIIKAATVLLESK